MKKYSYKIVGLDCANCAREVEERLKEEKYLNNVVVNFSTLKLSFETEEDVSKKEIEKIVVSVEPEVKLLELGESYAQRSIADFDLLRLILGAIMMLSTLFLKDYKVIHIIFIIIAYILLLSKTFINALKLLLKKSINENFLISLSCIGAFFIGEYFEGLMVIFLYEVGKLLENKAINNSRNSISDLTSIKPDFANLEDGSVVKPEKVNIGDIIVIKPGEKIPLDGKIIFGNSKTDNSSLTGESKLVDVNVGDVVISGTINSTSMIKVRVTDLYENSTVNRILELVETATDKKAKTETFVSKFSKVYTPIVIVLAIAVGLFLPLVSDVTYSDSIYRALSFLVISCPCAIAISVPLSYFSGIGASSKIGILVKGSNFLDSIRNLSRIVFDKTGTLTSGKFGVTKVMAIDNHTKDEVIKYAALGESFSTHPIATSIVEYYNDELDTKGIKNYTEIAGKGISYSYKNNKVLVGNSDLVNSDKILETGTIVYVKVDNDLIGYIVLNDVIKEESYQIVRLLQENNISVNMFTGDNKISAKEVADSLGITDYKYSMLPKDKHDEIEKYINSEKGVVAFVGDGINDAPVLALSDIGISMGLTGSSAAIEASDVVIMSDNLGKIKDLIDISKFTNRIIKENLVFALSVKVLVLVLCAIGIGTMWQAIFADVGVTLITILNTVRILRRK